MNNVKNIAVDSILPNSFRNFKLYPMAKDQVSALADSYDTEGDFGIIPVRPLGGGMYEQACGHHRVAAMKALGFTTVRCVVSDYDDDHMVGIMINENSRQKGDNAPAALDSLSAVTRMVAYYLLISDTALDFAELVGSYAGAPASDSAFKLAKTKIAKGEPVPYTYLTLYAGDGIGGRSQVQELNNQLQDSGELGRIYKAVVKRVTEETAEQEEAEQAAEAARKKAIAKAEREEKAAQAAAKKASELAAKAGKARKAAAEAAAKQAAKDAKKKAKLRAAEMVRQQAEREEADAARAERKRKVREANEAAEAAAELGKGLHPDVLHMLKAQRHIEAFRKVVATEEGKRVFPVAKQVQAVREMLVWADDLELTTALIKEYLNEQMIQSNKELKALLAQSKANQEKLSVRRKVDGAIDGFRRTVANTNLALQKLGKVLDDDITGEYAYKTIAMDVNMGRTISELENMVQALRASLTLREKYVRTQPVIDVEGELVD
jgi:hypothetical protein